MSHCPGCLGLTFLSVFAAVQVFSLQAPGHFAPGSVDFILLMHAFNTCALKSFLKLFLCPVLSSLEFCLHEVQLSQHTQTQVSVSTVQQDCPPAWILLRLQSVKFLWSRTRGRTGLLCLPCPRPRL